MSAVCNMAGHIYSHPVVCSSFFFFSSPNLGRHRFDVYHTCTHGVALARIYDSGPKRAARGSPQIQDAKSRQKIAIWAPSHNFVGLYLRNEGTYRQSEKKLVKQQYLVHMFHNMVNFGPLAAEICPVVWGTPANSNGFRVLAASLHGTPVLGVSQTLRR